MRNLICRATRISPSLCFTALVMAFTSTTASAQVVNSWVSPESGTWDYAGNWSMSILPDSSQSVQITNSGWKAVAINPTTPVAFPDSMTVSNLTIRGAWDTENVLLLNYAGTDVPLRVMNGLRVQDNAQIVNLDSGLEVQSGNIFLTNAQIIRTEGLCAPPTRRFICNAPSMT